MSVQIMINGGDAAEAVKELSALAAAIGGVVAPEPEKPKKNVRTKPEPEKEPETDPVGKVSEDTEDAKDFEDNDGGGAEDVPTVVELRAKAQEVGSVASKKPKIKALLDEFEVANITAVPEDRRTEFMGRLEKL